MHYKYRARCRKEDLGAHEMHIGFSAEEQKRIFNSKSPMFVNRFPLVEMGLTRADNYRYCLESWGLDTKASACNFCPFHRNYFFKYLKDNHINDYERILAFDKVLLEQQPNTPIRSQIFISRSRKRIVDLTDEDCCDMETFEYNGNLIWNGF